MFGYIDLKKVAQHLTEKDLWPIPLSQWSADDMQELGRVMITSPGPSVPGDGWIKPRLVDGKLVMPADVHPKYRWWTEDGQPLWQTLSELGADAKTIAKYSPTGVGEGVKK